MFAINLPERQSDFHIVWAIRKSLELLNFNERGLKAIDRVLKLKGMANSYI
jgi:hypothetical protein